MFRRTRAANVIRIERERHPGTFGSRRPRRGGSRQGPRRERVEEARFVREVIGVSEKIGKGKESPMTAGESEPANVERATEKPVVVYPDLGRYFARVRRELAEWYQANVGATTEAVGAEEPEHGVEKTSPEKSDDGDSGSVWMTPKAKKTARKRSATS
ncbi:hypothetical protein KFL_013020015 [Klebsormidium nitens]|uniref:Uncharacterized protein n=1 Tax=Klebsormidium nitens TaxID=105231 RepID=A0A1Y1IXT5_KLENI|nr:hypothetical protein KFL_013020015 [Klebsormidium nitens]|eukprot:GAQ93108.1 hypothetical protein KFL_013020015 [Klebsormidium nitens]